MKSGILLGLALLLGGLALCGAGLWLLLSPPQYAATARIKLENDVTDSPGIESYGGYFPQASLEIIQSPLVLSNVVASLKLNDVWGEKQHHGRPLTTAESIKVIQGHLRVAPVRNTSQIAITYYSDTPDEAAAVANAIAEGYRDYRTKSLENLILKGLETLTQQFKDEEGKIRAAQTNVTLMREKFHIQDEVSTNHPAEQQPYWDKKQELDRMLNIHQLLWLKIEALKSESVPTTVKFQFVAPAEPPRFPVGTNRPLGAALLAVGLFPLLGGMLLLKSKP